MITSPQTNRPPEYFDGCGILPLQVGPDSDLFDQYERQKAAIARRLLTPKEYAKAIRRLAEDLGV